MAPRGVEEMIHPFVIRFSQKNIGEQYKDDDLPSIWETRDSICGGMGKYKIEMIHVVRQPSGRVVTLDNRRLAVYKMVAHAGKCGRIKVLVVPIDEVQKELRRKSDSKDEGLSVTVRRTDKTVHADGRVTTAPELTDGQLQHRADQAAHWTDEERKHIKETVRVFESAVRRVLGQSSSLELAGSYLKGTEIAGESDVDVMVFGPGAIPNFQWQMIAKEIESPNYKIEASCPRCIHVNGNWNGKVGCIRIDFDVVANQAQGFPPNKVPQNPFKENRIAARAVRNIKLDLKESGEEKVGGHWIEEAVLSAQKDMSPVTLRKVIDAAKVKLRSSMAQPRKRQRTA